MSGSLTYTVFSSGTFDFDLQPAVQDSLIRIEDNGGITYANGPLVNAPGTLLQLATVNPNWQTQFYLNEGQTPAIYVRGSSGVGPVFGGWYPVPVGVARSATISGLRALDVSGLNGANCAALVDGYTSAGDEGGGIFDWNSSITTPDDGVIVFKPNAITTGPGRWVRRLANGVITPEMAGASGDYNFTTDTGTNNWNAFSSLFSK